MGKQELLVPSQVAKMCGVTVRTVQRWVKAGHFPNATQLPGRKAGRYRIPRGDVETFIAQMSERVRRRWRDREAQEAAELADRLERVDEGVMVAALAEMMERVERVETRSGLALIVEDDEDAGAIFELTLKGAGFDTVTVGSGERALAVMEAMAPDVVVLDLQLPDVAGMEVLRRVRGEGKLAGVPVIVATAYPELAEGIEEQADLVLIKPVRYGVLQEKAVELTGS